MIELFSEIAEVVVLLVLFSTLLIGSYSDIKKREVDRILFLPLMVLALLVNVLLFKLYAISLFSSVLFLCLFFSYNTKLYALITASTIVLGLVAIFIFEPSQMITWSLESLFSLLVLGEILFGVGDIKAIVSVIFSTIFLPFNLLRDSVLIPFSFVFTINLGLVSVAAMFWGFYSLYKLSGTIGMRASAENIKDINPVIFHTFEYRENKYIRYNIPFIEFILFATIITFIGVKFQVPF